MWIINVFRSCQISTAMADLPLLVYTEWLSQWGRLDCRLCEQYLVWVGLITTGQHRTPQDSTGHRRTAQDTAIHRSLQKVQGHRTAQGRVDVDVTPPTGGPVGHPPNPATLCDRSAQGSKSWHSGSFAKYSDIGLVTISFPACCVSHRATGLPVTDHDMHTRRPDYLQACPTGPPVEGVKSALTPALCGPVPFAVTRIVL